MICLLLRQPGAGSSVVCFSKDVKVPVKVRRTLSSVVTSSSNRTFDIFTKRGGEKSTVASLFVNLESPADEELQVGPMPSFIPRKKAYKKFVSTSSSALTVLGELGHGIISSCCKPPRYVPYKFTYVPYDGTFGASDQGQMLDM
jgi:hypothetical protein